MSYIELARGLQKFLKLEHPPIALAIVEKKAGLDRIK